MGRWRARRNLDLGGDIPALAGQKTQQVVGVGAAVALVRHLDVLALYTGADWNFW
jgi:hypothetical protein